MNLYFVDSKDNKRFVAKVMSREKAFEEIERFCSEHNFSIPYFRYWGSLDKNGINIDCGSHVEFFKLEKSGE